MKFQMDWRFYLAALVVLASVDTYGIRKIVSPGFIWSNVARVNDVFNDKLNKGHGYYKVFRLSFTNLANVPQEVKVTGVLFKPVLASTPAGASGKIIYEGTTIPSETPRSQVQKTLNLEKSGTDGEAGEVSFTIIYRGTNYLSGVDVAYMYGRFSIIIEITEKKGAIVATFANHNQCNGGCLFAKSDNLPPDMEHHNLLHATEANMSHNFQINGGRPF